MLNVNNLVLLDNTRSLTRYLFQLFSFFAPITAFVIYECCSYIKVIKTTSSIPIMHIRKAMKADIRKKCYIDARFSLWDFAGQEMYYNTHHLFMPKQGVYLVVFNAAKAISDPYRHIKRLQFWLQSIAMHADIENVVVFLVGTRRESICDTNVFSAFEKLLNAHIYKRFSRLLAFHPKGGLCFFIENALSDDKECNLLREIIYKEVQLLKYFCETFSVKYLLFKEILNGLRCRNCVIASINDIENEIISKINVFKKYDLRKILNCFDKSGDIIYNEHDEWLRNYIVCDPQVLIDILKLLVNVPEPHQRNRTVSDLWQRLLETGIIDSRLVEHICRMKGIWRVYPYVIRFLVETHLLFPLTITNEIDQVGTFYLCSRLPETELQTSKCICVIDLYEIFYFDFGEILLEYIFLRLIAKCCKMFNWINIYYNAAKFRASESCLFQINTETISAGSIFFYDRNLIKLSVTKVDPNQSVNILHKITTFIEEIVQQTFSPDYVHEQFVCGPVCERCSSLDGTLCLVNIVTIIKDVSAIDEYRTDDYHTISLKSKFNLVCNRPMNNDDDNQIGVEFGDKEVLID
ncbi:uncharacterized protein [Antedon mediterranea]|uniref:uncharacterized protein n=1 Tax=Antedon mediterranea TaxID=105859 RepID=UPI003AF72BDA